MCRKKGFHRTIDFKTVNSPPREKNFFCIVVTFLTSARSDCYNRKTLYMFPWSRLEINLFTREKRRKAFVVLAFRAKATRL